MSWLKVLVITCVFIISATLFGQLNMPYTYSYPEFNKEDSQNLYLQIENHNFFWNAEYFGDFVEGYTLAGFEIKPSLQYYFNSKFRLQAGVLTRKIHGAVGFYDVIPTISAHACLSDSFQIIIGTLKGSNEHEMLHPIYDSELLFFDRLQNGFNAPVENGFQLLYTNSWIKGDMWVDWEQFIVKGDTIPEILTFGLNTTFDVFKTNNTYIKVPFQFLIHHQGGQISNFDEAMLTLNNGATGVVIERNSSHSFIKKISMNGYLLWYNDITEAWQSYFNNGWALYPSFTIESGKIQLFAGYFYGNNFASPKGSYLFQSISDYKKSAYQKERQLIIGKFNYHKLIAKNVNFAVILDGFYDLKNSRFDMAFGVSIIANPQLFLAQIKSN